KEPEAATAPVASPAVPRKPRRLTAFLSFMLSAPTPGGWEGGRERPRGARRPRGDDGPAAPGRAPVRRAGWNAVRTAPAGGRKGTPPRPSGRSPTPRSPPQT